MGSWLYGLTDQDQFDQIVSPSPDDRGVSINQDAWFHLGELSQGTELQYSLKKPGNGVYAFILEGDVTIAGQSLNKRDGFGVWDTDAITVAADGDARVLLMEVPMEF